MTHLSDDSDELIQILAFFSLGNLSIVCLLLFEGTELKGEIESAKNICSHLPHLISSRPAIYASCGDIR